MGESFELRAPARKVEHPARAFRIDSAGFFNRQRKANVGGAVDDLGDGSAQTVDVEVKPEIARDDGHTGNGPRRPGENSNPPPRLCGLKQRKPLASDQTSGSG